MNVERFKIKEKNVITINELHFYIFLFKYLIMLD
jgi:hypothetical protein